MKQLEIGMTAQMQCRYYRLEANPPKGDYAVVYETVVLGMTA